MGRAAKQKWTVGDEFALPLVDGTYGHGQVIAAEPLTLKNAVVCAFFDSKFEQVPTGDTGTEKAGRVYSVLWTTRDVLDLGEWKVFGSTEAMNPRTYFPDIDERRAKGFVGTKVYGSGIARKLVNAFFGLLPWDGFMEPGYLDKLLLSPEKKPYNRIVTKQ